MICFVDLLRCSSLAILLGTYPFGDVLTAKIGTSSQKVSFSFCLHFLTNLFSPEETCEGIGKPDMHVGYMSAERYCILQINHYYHF